MLIVGGGTGGVAAALALWEKGLTVILTEETDWLGGQFTSQCVPPDEHPWIEQFGSTRRYRQLRERARSVFRSDHHGSLTARADSTTINPGGGWVSRLTAPPECFHKAISHWFESLPPSGRASAPNRVFLHTVPIECSVQEARVDAVKMRDLRSGVENWIEAEFVLDATELGDVLALSETDHVVGAESKHETQEPHALDGQPERENVQAFTWCAAIGFDSVGNHTISKPDQYELWRQFVPPHWTGKLLDLTFPNVRTGEPMTLPVFDDLDTLTLFGYRQILDPSLFLTPIEPVTIMNWPQNDYTMGSVIGTDEETTVRHYEAAKQLTLSVLYWLQTDLGLSGLRLRPDITGTEDGLAKAPYHRESRRIRALETVTELDVSPDCHPGLVVAPNRIDSVGIGAYRIDLHPSANGAKTIDIGALPFQIPLGALVPRTVRNLLPACKNLGTTHVTNGCFRLHPVEWNIGEAAGLLAHFCLARDVSPQKVHENTVLVAEFQQLLSSEGVELAWPQLHPL